MLDFGANKNLPTVLLIDDDMVSREVAATVLTLGGYPVYTAENGAAAIAMLAADSCAPGVILVDAQMPGLSGAELIGALRKLSQAVVVAMSGSNAPRELTAAADGFLLKPFGAEALGMALHELSGSAGKTASAADARGTAKRPGAAAEGKPAKRAKRGDASTGDGEGTDREVVRTEVIRAEVLVQFRQMMPEAAVREIYGAIVVDLENRLGDLERAVEVGDTERVRSIGHAIKGGCGMAGAMEASRLGALLEAVDEGGEGNQLDNSAQLARDLRDALAHLKSILISEFPA